MDLLNNIPPHLFRMIIAVAVVIGFVFANATVMGYLERKLAGRFQRRLGPMEVGWHGILQMPVDGIKLIAKQLIVPDNVAGVLFYAAPIIALAPVALPFLVIPFAPGLQVIDLDVGVIFLLTMISFNTVAVFLAGWSSNNNYAMIGAMRAVAQNISYEIPILLSVLAIALMTNTFSMKAIIEAQKSIWFIIVQPAAFIMMFICAIAETNRAPFDLAEGESELTAGFHTEYSGIAFSTVHDCRIYLYVCELLPGNSTFSRRVEGHTAPLWRVQLLHLVFCQGVFPDVCHCLVPLDISPRAF